ncbi:MAG: hypothetical protein QXT00_02230 [Ignisphaera sp.]
MGLLYKIVMKDIEFLERLRKELAKRGAPKRTYFYFLAMLNNIQENSNECEKIIEWLKKENLLHPNFKL